MAALAVAVASLAGAASVGVVPAGGGDTFENDGSTLLIVVNNSGIGFNCTVAATGPCDHGTLHNNVVAVPSAAGSRVVIGPFPVARFGANPTATCSQQASVTIAAIRAR